MLLSSQNTDLVNCNKVYPDTDDEWQQALIGLLEEAQGFLKSVLTCIRKIEEDESVEEMVRQWEFRLRRHHPQHELLMLDT